MKTNLPLPTLVPNGSLLLTEVMKTVTSTLYLEEAPVQCWSDLTSVLAWIKKEVEKLENYGAN